MPDQEKSNIICVFQLAACSGWLHAASSQFCGPYLLVCLVSTDACLEFWSKSCIHAMTDSWVPALQQPCFMPALEHLIWKHVWTHSGRNFEQYGGITVSCNCLRCSMWVPSWILASRPLQVVGCCNVLCECITGICLLAIGGHLAVVKEHPTFFSCGLILASFFSPCRFVIKEWCKCQIRLQCCLSAFSLGRFSQGPFSLLLVGLQVCNYVDIIRWWNIRVSGSSFHPSFSFCLVSNVWGKPVCVKVV